MDRLMAELPRGVSAEENARSWKNLGNGGPGGIRTPNQGIMSPLL